MKKLALIVTFVASVAACHQRVSRSPAAVLLEAAAHAVVLADSAAALNGAAVGPVADEARSLALQVLSRDSSNADANFAIARIEAKLNRPAEASRAFLKVLAVRPDYPRAGPLALGQFWRAGMYEEGYVWGMRETRRDPRNTSVLWNLGVVLTFLGETTKADSIFQGIAEMEPGNLYSLGELAFSSAERGDTRAAVEYMRAAAARDTTNLINRNGIGHFLILDGRPREAIPLIASTLRSSPSARGYGGRSAHLLLGWAFLASGDSAMGRAHLDSSIALRTSQINSGQTAYQHMRELVDAYSLLGQHDIALTWALRALSAGWNPPSCSPARQPYVELCRRPEIAAAVKSMNERRWALRRKLGLDPASR